MPNARDTLYRNFPKKFVWIQKTGTWAPRKRGLNSSSPIAIGRLTSIHPTRVELFSMRTLLNYRCGCKSPEELRTVNGNLLPTFNKACLELGLCESDLMWKNCMSEEVLSSPARVCRNLFVTLIVHCGVNDRHNLFDTFQDSLKEDFVFKHIRHGLSQEEANEFGL